MKDASPRIVHALITSLLLPLALIVTVREVRSQQIPKVAWTRGLGQPLENPGVSKVKGNIDDGYWQGVPLGGFGSGSIGRTYRGDFARWHLKTGVHKYESIAPDVFAAYEQTGDSAPAAVVLRAGKPEGPGSLAAWNWSYPTGTGTYHALFPKAWYEYQYDKFPVQLICEQFSPVLPGNYKETSYPVGVFVWHARNTTQKPVKVSILFSWANMVGWFAEFNGGLNRALGSGNFNTAREDSVASGPMKGIVFGRVRNGPAETDSDGQFAIAAIAPEDGSISTTTTFDASGDGAGVWKAFAQDGTLDEPEHNWLSSGGNPVAGALAVKFTIKAGETLDIPMALAWDFPIVQFGSGHRWYRRYTEYFGNRGDAAWKIARTALENYKSWSKAIDEWQAPFISDDIKPAWYRGMLFNELYYLVDGGTFWDNGEVGKPASAEKVPHHFSYLECYDYSYYSTLDVRFYGSFALLKFWPELEKLEMRQLAQAVPLDYQQYQQIGWDHTLAPRKVPGAVPHDLGSPVEDPLRRVNQYNWQNITVWKDLNSKFVLQVYRDYTLTGQKDLEFLQTCWPAVKSALDYLKRFDTKGDGIPQNEGIPDQSYDNWKMRGSSAYCGSLWLAALKSAQKMALRVDDVAAAQKYSDWFQKAQASLVQELWNGRYFNYDTESPYKTNIMADQLAGQWYADLCGLGLMVPKEDTRSALETIFKSNVMGFENGQMGAVNGMNADGSPITENEQSEEVWSGTTLALASFFKAEGMTDEAYKTAQGVYNVVYEKQGYWFRTPEAWDRTGNFRAEMYMRPQAIWAMEFVK